MSNIIHLPPRADSVDSFASKPSIQQPGTGEPISDSLKPAEGLYRRTDAALAMLPAALPAAAEAIADPIFSLIEAHRAAMAAWLVRLRAAAHLAIDPWVEVTEQACHDANVAFQALVAEPATTWPGLVAKVAYLHELSTEHETHWMIDECVHTVALINSLTASLEVLA